MRVIFMGTPYFALPTLERLYQNKQIDLIAVVTQPDRINRRGNKSVFSPIKKFALEHDLCLLQPDSIRTTDFLGFLKKQVVDVIIVVAYGKILPAEVLNLPKYGCLNIHASLLPKYRGAAPIQQAILDGCHETGVSIMMLDEGMDTGDILLTQKLAISETMDTNDLTYNLANLGAESLLKVLEKLPYFLKKAQVQNHENATYADKIEKQLGKINWTYSAIQIHRLVNALHANPGTFTTFRGKRLKIHKTFYDDTKSADLGEIKSINKEYIEVGTGNGVLFIFQVQPENKSIMSVKDWIHGYQIKEGERFE